VKFIQCVKDIISEETDNEMVLWSNRSVSTAQWTLTHDILKHSDPVYNTCVTNTQTKTQNYHSIYTTLFTAMHGNNTVF